MKKTYEKPYFKYAICYPEKSLNKFSKSMENA